ncbi:hypothetical protein G7Y89_g1883 [Cudoniella acicularis]|uniref:CN hydrolase domain-containing protein n=1 Tax=Cudoniella acicularis TaxID=354080 RepID=A0A8H4RWB2_9HELO|nr:hypothetical protein G7Y89_g1883 [Cudoniella acicularis]
MANLLKKPVKLALIQLASGADKADNLTHAHSQVFAAAAQGANITVLPECFNSPYGCDFFTPLSEHQTRTPTSFFGETSSSLPCAGNEAGENSERAASIVVVDVYVSSENLTVFNPATLTGIEIPYPAISLHAIQRLDDPSDSSQQVQGLYMQLELSDPDNGVGDDEEDAVELTLIPQAPADAERSAIQTLFEAVSNCSNLHPDPLFGDDVDMEDGDVDDRIVFEGNVGYEGISGLPNVQRGTADGGLPPPFPGSGGWITAENVSEYFDEDGNYIADAQSESLGQGAGSVRSREEVEESSGVNGHGEPDSAGNKRVRTD